MPLILKRKIGQAIIIDHDIRVEIVKAHDGQLALQIDAPHHIDVNRAEVEANRKRGNVKPHKGSRGNYLQRRHRDLEGSR